MKTNALKSSALQAHGRAAKNESKKDALGPRAVGWLESNIDEWIQSRIELLLKLGDRS